MQNTIKCICNGYSKPVINIVECDQIAGTKDEIFETAKNFKGFILNQDTITFEDVDYFQNFWHYIMKNYIK